MHWIRGQLEAFSYRHHFLFHIAAASFVGDGKKKRTTTPKKNQKNPNFKITPNLSGFAHFPMSPGKRHHCYGVTFDQKSKGWVLEKEKTLPHRALTHSNQGLKNFLKSVSNAQNISSASPAFSNMPLCTLESSASLLAQVSGMSHTWQMLN